MKLGYFFFYLCLLMDELGEEKGGKKSHSVLLVLALSAFLFFLKVNRRAFPLFDLPHELYPNTRTVVEHHLP